MGQAKLPAKCCECGLVGPARKKAAKQGWIRKPGTKPEWLCPEHGPAWARAETKRILEQRTKNPRPQILLPPMPRRHFP